MSSPIPIPIPIPPAPTQPDLSTLFRHRDWSSLETLIQTHPTPHLYSALLPCGHTPLQLASLLGATRVVSALLRLGLRVDASALFHAASNGHVDVLRLLVAPTGSTACTPVACRCGGRAPGAGQALHAASWRANCAAAGALLEALCPAGRRAALGYRAADGATPLHAAALDGDAGLAQRFVDAGARVLARDRTGRTARDWAKRYVVAAGKGQDVVDVLARAEESLRREWAGEAMEGEAHLDERLLDEEGRFAQERAACVPRSTQQQRRPAAKRPACHAA